MTELKTLKDLDTKLIYNGIDTPHPYEVIENFKKTLKSEAVKWVKDIREKTPKEIIGIPNHISIWIKHFFNITVEDLKC